MRLKQPNNPRREPDLTGLINVIFLILIFFMIAGTMRPFTERDLQLPRLSETSPSTVSPNRLIAHADGRLTYRGNDIALEAIHTTIAPRAATGTSPIDKFTLIADARLDATKAIAVISALKRAGITNITILTQRPPR